VGQVERAVAELDALAQAQVQSGVVPGLAIAVVFQGRAVYAKGLGVKDTTTNEAVDADTVFQLASVSKPIGSSVVAALVGEGTVSWDSRIHDLDPAFSMYDPWVTREITIRDFYAHRSGLPMHSGDLLEDLGFTRAEILHRLRFQEPDTSFRSGYAYTNFGMTEAAIAAAQATGREWEDVSAEKLYRPLGMDSTSSRYADFLARANRVRGHVMVGGAWAPKYQRNPDAQSPAGGVSSSVNDMAKWLRFQLSNGRFEGRQVVAESALAETHHPHMLTGFSRLTGLPSFYGLGWNVSYDDEGRLRLGHSGAFALGAATTVDLVPSQDLGVVVLTNAYPVGVAEGLANTFMDLALHGAASRDWLSLLRQAFSDPAAVGVVVGTDYSKPPASPSASLARNAYLGTYHNSFFGEARIIEKDEGLALVVGPQGLTFPLSHYDRDIFTFVTEGENAVGATGVSFSIGPDGRATAFLVENWDVDENGTFLRVPGGAGAS
jgi:CubicO group peptidase (beta-lactamase class C family)